MEDILMKMNKKGFTLIELLIVVAIIAILAAIAIPQFGAYRARAVRSAMVADSKNIATSLETLFQDCNSYSPSNGLTFTGPAPGDLMKTTASCTAMSTPPAYAVNASKGNTVTIASDVTSYTLSVSNASGNDNQYTGPVGRTNTGACAWVVGGGC